ncbi:MAG: MFS transporter [Oscillospiraceae bacterium]|jgi:Na+/melibiose symporter-like transporter|nr:MFS transporter [Oscillospiraceae bacterium]
MGTPTISQNPALQSGKAQGHSIARTLAISLAFAWISIFNAVLDNGLPVILTAPLEEGGLALNFTAKGVVMAIDNILGLFLLPLFGWLSDKSKSKLGKRTPYIIAGGVLAAVLWAGTGLALGLHVKWLFLILLTGALASIAFSRPASLALLPDFTAIPHRRTANAITQIVSIVCTVVGLLVIMLFTQWGYDKIFYVTSVLMAVLIVLFLFTVKERRWQPPEQTPAADEVEAGHAQSKNRAFLLASLFFFYVAYNGLVSSLPNYAKEVLGLGAGKIVLPMALTLAAAMLFAAPAAKLAQKFRRKPLLLLGVGLMIAAFATASLQPALNLAMYASFALTGGGFSVALVNLYPFMLELSDATKIGSATGIFNTVMTLAMVITPIASGWLSDRFGLWTLFPYCIAALGLSFLAILLISKEKKVRHA